MYVLAPGLAWDALLKFSKAELELLANPDMLLFFETGMYSWAKNQPLPVGNFSWMSEEELDNWENFPCVLEVDLKYPKEIHDAHNDYPLGPESLEIGQSRVKKLVPNLRDKRKKTFIRKT